MGQNAVAWQRRAISQSEHGKWDCLQDDRVADICTCAVLESLGRYVSDMRKKKEMGHRRDLGYTRCLVLVRLSVACHVRVTCSVVLPVFNFVLFHTNRSALWHRPRSCNGEQTAVPRSFPPQSPHISYAPLPSFQIFPSQTRRHTHTHASLQPCRPSPA
jgi:hypothetical protein